MNTRWRLSPERILTEEEMKMIWQKPDSHIESEQERRMTREVYNHWHSKEMKIQTILLEGDAGSGKTQLAKALSANLGLPYTKITCFSDMDKSDVLGAILPVVQDNESDAIAYEYYPSEIVRAFEKGYLLEIQEPTVIRDAAVLMALNAALEPEGVINLPTRTVKRHPDFMTVITTNRGYNGCRPLNEALRDRVQHAEKMDLPSIEVMVARGKGKVDTHTLGEDSEAILNLMARTIRILDEVAKANAIKGVAGMRSFFYWLDSVSCGQGLTEALYYKVIYKITTDPEEIKILQEALQEMLVIDALATFEKRSEGDEEEDGEYSHKHSKEDAEAKRTREDVLGLRKHEKSKGHSEDGALKESQEHKMPQISVEGTDIGEGLVRYHALRKQETNEATPELALKEEENKRNRQEAIEREKKKQQRKGLNREARCSVNGTIHDGIRMIVHRPEITEAMQDEYERYMDEVRWVVTALTRSSQKLFEYEASMSYSGNKLYGTRFMAENIGKGDFRYFAKKNPPDEEPSLAVVLRIDESASMKAFGRIEGAKGAALVVFMFCKASGIPITIYGDTADQSPMEQMSMYAYTDFSLPFDDDDGIRLMAIEPRSNNRDGMALKVLSDKLDKRQEKTKLFICISDGQPKAMPDYTGRLAQDDMQNVIEEYTRKGIHYIAAAIGKDKTMISDIYGADHFIDISDLNTLPKRLVRLIARYM